ncbi:serine hydrolase domain-containing protein [Hymenobacter glaciei]|uniref:Beta-lactamase n=2 Tax=Hymenobacter glaciei TaxID=877209 RepID=A0ABP7U6P1_9BACT
MDTVVQRLGNAFMQQPARVGLSIGITQNGRAYFYHFGTTEKGKSQVATQNTPYEIGSISKTFTSLLLAHAVLEKRVSLNDDIRKYLPGAYPNLAFQGKPITLKHLANTTSRLPNNLPKNLLEGLLQHASTDSVPLLAVKRMRGYTKQNFLADLHQARLDTFPGLLPRHSNVASQLLAYMLESVYQASYADLLVRYIDQPLHLTGSAGTGPKSTGYDGNGHHMPYDAIETSRASGGLQYSPADMVKYLQYQLAASDKAVALVQQPTWGRPDAEAIAFNWNLDQTVDGKRRLQHSGGTFGYASYCELYPQLQFGIVLLANESDPNTQAALQATAWQIVDALYGVPPALQALRAGLAASQYRQAAAVVTAVKKKHPELHLTEAYVNTWGYTLLQQGQPKAALELFKLNVSLYPHAWNAYDSLAETYESADDKPQAIENYRRSLALNPRNANAAEHLRKLGAK